jgi:hypothetical protein
LFLLRTLQIRDNGAVVAALVYMLTPYPLAYTARISAILLPWAGMPWLIALAARAVKRGGWRDPAIFAIGVLVVGGTNATSLLFAGIAPALWLVHVVVATREATWRQALATAARIGVLVIATSLWWIAGLVNQGRYGLPVLQFTETVPTVAQGSTATEVMRGLGNWFFYGGDGLGSWIALSNNYTQRIWLLLVSFALPTLALIAAACTRWRHRAYFVALLVLGVVIAVGAHPFDDPSPLGAAFKEFATGSSAGLALRSTPRAVPLVVLGAAVLLGTGVSALARFRPTLGLAAAGLAAVLAIVNLVPILGRNYVDPRIQRPEDIPDYWIEAAATLDRAGSDTRVLELPGSDFSAYRWGNTVDPLTPGLMDRPWVERELIPFGSHASADLLIALDHRLQEGVFEPDSLAPIARLMNAGDVLLRSDLEYERYRTPRPRVLWADFTDPLAAGLAAPEEFGPDVVNRAGPGLPLLDEIELAIPKDASEPPPVAIFGVENPVPIVHTASTRNPVLIAGDGEGVVDAAAAGVIDGTETLLYSASFEDQPDELQRALDDGADLLLTDTNRRRARRWATIRETTGYTETAGEVPLEDDTSDQRLQVFPDADDDARTVTIQRGVRRVVATRYGQPNAYYPENRAANAMDGDVLTAWRVGRFADVTGERLVIELDEPVTTDHINVVQPLTGVRERYITGATLHFDEGPDVDVALDESSLTPDGQNLAFEERTFQKLEIEIDETNVGTRFSYGGTSAVGFAEVRIDDQHVDEVVRLPVDLPRAVAGESLDHRLVIMMTRLRADPAEVERSDEEPTLIRLFEVPDAREFAFSGTARVSAAASDPIVDEELGTNAPGLRVESSSRMAGDLAARGSRAFDGDPDTAWIPTYGEQSGQWVQLAIGDDREPLRLDHLNMVVIADGRHSVPTRVRIENENGDARVVEVPPVADREAEDATAEVPLSFDPIRGKTLRLVVEEVRPVVTTDYFSRGPALLPVAIAEAGVEAVRTPPLPATLPGTCRDLVTIDGEELAVRMVGDAAAAEARRGISLEPCDGAPITLDAGQHVLRAEDGRATGVDVDRALLSSARGGAARGSVALGPEGGAPGPEVDVTGAGRTSFDVRIEQADEPFWLVLGQSYNDGWRADVSGGSAVSSPTLVDAYANGWYIQPDGDGPIEVSLRWTPQRTVWFGLGLSAAALVLCMVLAIRPRRRRETADAPAPPALVSPLVAGGGTPGRIGILLGALAAAVVGALVADPVIGILVGGATALTLRNRQWRPLLTAGCVLAFGAAAAYVVVQQLQYRFGNTAEWPSQFDRVHIVTLLAVLLLGADALVEAIRGRARAT